MYWPPMMKKLTIKPQTMQRAHLKVGSLHGRVKGLDTLARSWFVSLTSLGQAGKTQTAAGSSRLRSESSPKMKTRPLHKCSRFLGRGERTRTFDLTVPNRAR